MEIKERLENDLKGALKKRDEITVSTLRMVKASLHNREIEKKGEALSEEEIIKVITKQVQQHQESIEHFKKGKREDLVAKETKELEILKSYLPEQLQAEELTEIVKRIIAKEDVQDKAIFGKVMKLVMAELKGRADGKLVSQIVSSQLTPKE